MTRHPIALAIALALGASVPLYGCDRVTGLTEQEHIQRAKDFEDKGNLKGSIVELKNAIQKNPNSPQARLLLGQIYLKAGMSAEAEKELTRAEKLGVSRESIKLQLGEALVNLGEYQRVLEEIQPGEQTSGPNLARIYQLRADALLGQGQLKPACELFQRSLDTDRNNPATYWGLARCAIAERNMPAAQEWLDAALKLPEKQARTWVFIGDLKQVSNDIEGSLSAYSSALKIDPANPGALQSRATINTVLGRLEPARIDVDKVRELYPKSVAASYLQAFLHFAEKKYPEAREASLETLKMAPDYLPSLLLAGRIESALGNLQMAETYFGKVLRVVPRNGFALRALATTQLRLGRPDDATKTIAPIDIENSSDPGLLALAGDIAVAKKNFSRATFLFEKAAALSPGSAAIRSELGMVRLAQGDERAMDDLQTAARMEGAAEEVDSVIILSLIKRKQFDAALDSIARLEKKRPEEPLAAYYRGVTLLGKEDIAKARASFEQALALDPVFLPAATSLAALDMLDNKPDAARARFEAVLKEDANNVRAMMALADLAASRSDEPEQVKWLEKAIKTDPRALAPRSSLVQHRLAKKEPGKALALAREAVDANPEDLGAQSLLGTTQMAAGDAENAVATFTKLAQKRPDSTDLQLRLVLAQVAAKKYAEARTTLNRSLQGNPDNLQMLDTLVRLELADKKPQVALQVAQQMQKRQPKSPVGHDRAGDILASLKRHPEAVAAYRQALTLGAPSATLVKLLGVMTAAGDRKGADNFLATWIAQHPADREARRYAAQLHMRSGRNRDAIAQLEAVQRQYPDDVAAINDLALLYQLEKDVRARPTAEQALRLAPDNAAVMDTLGWILVDEGQFKRALELLGKASARAAKAGSIQYHYAVALARSGNKAEAKKQLRLLLGSDAKFPERKDAEKLLNTL